MHKMLAGLPLVIALFLSSLILPVEAKTVKDMPLNAKQEELIAIAAFTACGDAEKLKSALNRGLDAGLTVNEIKEILVQMYAYAGFPRSLNGIGTFMAVMDERKAKGLKDDEGRQAAPLPAGTDKDAYGARVRAELAGQKTIPAPSGYQLFAPAIDTFLKEHLFADIFSRGVLDHQSRELATVAALASMPGLGAQLRFHWGAALNTGLTAAQLRDVIAVLEARIGKQAVAEAAVVLDAVLASRQGSVSAP